MRQLRVVLALVALAAACVGNGEPKATDRQDAEVYSAVVRWYAERHATPPASDDPPVAFLDGLGEHSVPIEVQVGIVQALTDDVTVRFIDALEEAVDTQAEGAPVRSGGFLVRFGAVVPRDDSVEVDVERYEGDEETSRHRFVLVPAGDQWRVSGDPSELPPPADPS